MYPAPTILCAIIIGIAYFIIRNIGGDNIAHTNTIATKNYGIHSLEQEINRREALRSASLFLAPYKDLWSGQKLSNKYCSLQLGYNGQTIMGKDLTNPNKNFIISKSSTYTNDELWNLFLVSFGRYTNYNKLIELCSYFNTEYKEYLTNKTEQNYSTTQHEEKQLLKLDITDDYSTTKHSYNADSIFNETVIKKEKLDINNASEAELTALPGVSIVLAKKLIKKREELNGFKNIEDVILFLKLKLHMENQVRELICVKRMKGSDKIKRYNERNIDL